MPRVTIDNNFSVEVPRGMKYSTDPNEIAGQLLAAIEDSETQDMMETLLGMSMIQGAFMIPKGISIQANIGKLTADDGAKDGEIDLYDPAFKEFIISPAHGMSGTYGKEIPKSQFKLLKYDNKDIIAAYGRMEQDDTVLYMYSLIVNLNIYVGVINASETGGFASQEAYVKDFLRSVRSVGKSPRKSGNTSSTKSTVNKVKSSTVPKKEPPKEKGFSVEKPNKVLIKTINEEVNWDELDKVIGIEALQYWIGKDFVFFNENDYSFNGTHFDIESMQLNSARMDELPPNSDFNKISVLLKNFVEELEKNEAFTSPIKQISDDVKEVVGDKGFTGFSMLLLLQEHLFNIAYVSVDSKDKAKNSVIVGVDPIVKDGVPDIEKKIEELIKFALEYNGNNNEFQITFYDAPEFEYESKSGETYEEPSKDSDTDDLSTAFADFGNFTDNVNKGGLYNEQGTINALLVQQLYDHDVVFNRDEEMVYDGSHNKVKGVQLNKSQVDNYPAILDDPEHFVQEFMNVLLTVEQNENLMIPKSDFHKNLLPATRNAPITGMTFFLFSQHHMMSIGGSIDSDSYTVAADVDLMLGIPHAAEHIGEFIKTLRNYNNIYEDFTVKAVGTRNMDSPCDSIDKPVAEANGSTLVSIDVKGK